jgi:flagellar motor switch protein FliG
LGDVHQSANAPGGSAASLAGGQKAAVLLLALGEQRAATILAQLSAEDAEALSLQIATLPRVESELVRTVVSEATENVLAADYVGEGGLDYAYAALERSVGAARAREILARLSAQLEKRPFEFLRRATAQDIATYLRSEPPQTAALVIAHLHAQLAAQVLMLLEHDAQADISRRIAALAEVSPDVTGAIEQVMRRRLTTVVAQRASSAGGTTAVAQIVTTAGRATERHVLEGLDKHDPELAEQIRRQLFTFDDIANLDDRTIQIVLREVDAKDLPFALRGAGASVAERIYANMSERGAELLREEIAYQPPQRRRVIEDAQSRVVAVIRRLEAEDAISLGRGSEDELI